jgi:ABC-type glycerol-3-phosphate transport system substrate-binding protein
MNKTRKILIIVILVVVSVCITSCKEAAQEITSDNKVNELNGKVNIWASTRDADLLNKEVALFNKKYPKVQVNITNSDINIIKDNLSKDLKDKSKLPDIISLEDTEVPTIVSKFKDNLLDEESTVDFKSDSYVKYQIHNSTYDSNVYACPWYVDPVFMVYRQDILRNLNVNSEDIKYWSQYVNIGAGPVKLAGKAMLSIDYFNNSLLYNIGLRELGINYFSDDDKLDLEDSITPAQLVFNAYNNKILYDSNKLGEEQNFSAGNTLSLVCNLSTLRDIENKYPNLKGKLNVEKVPAFEAGGNRDVVEFGENIIALKNSNKNRAAMEFIKFLSSSDESSSLLFDNYGYLTSNTVQYTNSKFYNKDSFYNKYLGRMAIDEANSLVDVKYNKYFPQIRDMVQNTIIDSSISNKDLKQSIYNVQNTLKASNIINK